MEAMLADENRFARCDHLANDAGAQREFELKQFIRGGFERGLAGGITAPEGRRVVNVLEDDIVTLDEVESHGLGLERFNDLGRGELDDGVDVLAAGLGFGDDLDEQ
jgi:hypothetical protein